MQSSFHSFVFSARKILNQSTINLTCISVTRTAKWKWTGQVLRTPRHHQGSSRTVGTTLTWRTMFTVKFPATQNNCWSPASLKARGPCTQVSQVPCVKTWLNFLNLFCLSEWHLSMDLFYAEIFQRHWFIECRVVLEMGHGFFVWNPVHKLF